MDNVQESIAELREVWLEARLFAGNFASRGDILRLKALGVEWDGNVRRLQLEPEASTE